MSNKAVTLPLKMLRKLLRRFLLMTRGIAGSVMRKCLTREDGAVLIVEIYGVEKMKVNIELKIKPFTVPNFAVSEDSDKLDLSLPLSMIDSYALDKMCDEFRSAVFKKAGKQVPPRQACNCS